MLTEHFYEKLTQSEDFSEIKPLITTDMRALAADVLCKCIERFDAELCENIPRDWKIHGHVERTLITLVGPITFKHTIFLDKYGRHHALTCELLGIPKYTRFSRCAFLWIAECAFELSYRKTAREFEELTNKK